MEQHANDRFLILVPVFNDWHAVALLLAALDHALAESSLLVEVLLVNDGSTQAPEAGLLAQNYQHLRSVEILHLYRNLGHQRAIAVGLVHIRKTMACRAVIVMDGDGEDRPRDVLRLVEEFERYGGRTIIFAERAKRLEKIHFRLCYRSYRMLHRLLTGVQVKVGNFSILPWQAVERLVVVSELWNHYAAAVFRARFRYRTIPLDRGRRLTGESRMNFVALLVHGFSAISVFSDVVAARLLVIASVLIALMAGLIGTLAALHWSPQVIVPVWVTFLAGTVFAIFSQALLASFFLIFTIISARANMTFIPRRDALEFVDRQEQVFRLDTLSIRRLRTRTL